MQIENLSQLGALTMDLAQSVLLPMLGVCFVISILFFILQVVFSITDFNLQFLVKLVIVVVVGAFMAKSFAEKYVEYSRAVFQSAAEMVR